MLFDAANDMNTYDAFQLSKGKGRKVTEDGKFNIDRDTFLEWLAMHDTLRAQGIIPRASVTFTDKAPDATLDLMVNGTTLFRENTICAQFLAWEGLMPDSIGSVTLPRGSESGGHLQYSMFWSVS